MTRQQLTPQGNMGRRAALIPTLGRTRRRFWAWHQGATHSDAFHSPLRSSLHLDKRRWNLISCPASFTADFGDW